MLVGCQGGRNENYRSLKKQKQNKNRRTGEITSKINHTLSNKGRDVGKGGEVGDLAMTVTPGRGVPVLHHALQSQRLLFIQHCNVWHFLLGGRV